ncbi:hypothetical protein MCANUFG4_03080 [Mycoplasmopsis canis UFG4]|uniref:Uncharacterized protein n=2 Tax=Mycoplasmopsis canis TaxID=29555 RepID=I1A4M2_9BACT|nr:hypothetical protein [Mycoplasmopsis canis]EIE41293.1 hypothetical protein MCANUFG1_03060 [Mycoplasmopsis canis UFG1]EIE41443.1 hypothetical protein MCANUFG4_03080 [Mycoplasmopsis canis UFG4]AMD81478.1 hypothetical protein AXW82_02895 [Mycoplasmopsis canis PG 14]EIE39503.1 hypothetical protein MCANPG14_03155 [Mycoplasmopsis canis PG 14]VEU69108.1 Uncharacterised protein [Mycoplasmopsis canis]
MSFFDTIYFNKIQKKIDFVTKIFVELKILENYKNNINIEKKMKEMFYIDEFIYEFCDNFSYNEKNLETNRNIINNFFLFFFYHQIFKRRLYWTKKQNNLNLKSKIHSIPFNSKKRSYYYNFLSEFQHINNYNIYLRKILKKVL